MYSEDEASGDFNISDWIPRPTGRFRKDHDSEEDRVKGMPITWDYENEGLVDPRVKAENAAKKGESHAQFHHLYSDDEDIDKREYKTGFERPIRKNHPKRYDSADERDLMRKLEGHLKRKKA